MHRIIFKNKKKVPDHRKLKIKMISRVGARVYIVLFIPWGTDHGLTPKLNIDTKIQNYIEVY